MTRFWKVYAVITQLIIILIDIYTTPTEISLRHFLCIDLVILQVCLQDNKRELRIS